MSDLMEICNQAESKIEASVDMDIIYKMLKLNKYTLYKESIFEIK